MLLQNSVFLSMMLSVGDVVHLLLILFAKTTTTLINFMYHEAVHFIHRFFLFYQSIFSEVLILLSFFDSRLCS